MKNKYLPIGTVCSIKGNTNKIMIVGFLSLDYNGNLNVYDYKGCVYPKGLFASGGTVSFNHDDIEKVEFMGYETDLHENLSSNLTNVSVVETIKKQTKNDSISKYVFDQNGVIIMDNTQKEEIKNENINTEINNPFTLNYNNNQNMSNNTNKFKFDENGVIIADNTVVKIEEKAKYKFDENGLIIEDNTITNESKKTTDENIISNEAKRAIESLDIESKYKFDENGVIISEN